MYGMYVCVCVLQVGCSILASLSQAGSDPVLPIMPR
eukprot:COSAG02_NODE_27774_length_603_cov_0.513889_1_plen_35_part_10